MRVVAIILGLLMGAWCSVAQAQQQNVWVQIGAQPTLSAAMDQARVYAALLENVQGYRLPSGGYAIVLGPMASDAAVETLHSLLAQNVIATDSALADGSVFGPQFWPVGAQVAPPNLGTTTDQTVLTPPPVLEPLADQTALDQEPPTPMPDAQSLPDAKAAELGLDEADRREVQTALKWFGFYAGLVDGNIGSGSRAGMANWQTMKGFDPTGVLTAGQRALLIDTYRSEQTAFGFEPVSDPNSGIDVILPMAMVSFDGTSPPFVRFGPKDGSGVTALLISQPGGTKASLSVLYDVLQTLDIMPAVGDRALQDTAFTIHGRNDRIETLAVAQIVGGAIKGYVLSWDVAKSDQMQRVVEVVQSSFRAAGTMTLDAGLVPLDAAAKSGLLAGLSVKEPKLTRSGFFIDQSGRVLTTIDAVDHCGTITLDENHGAKVIFTDMAKGIALLATEAPIAPRSVASFATQAPPPGSAITVSGYSYGARLSAPVLTQGTLAETKGLNGEPDLMRLSLQALPGDAGGPVIDGQGAVIGMLLAAPTKTARQLPAGVVFAVSSAALSEALTQSQGPALTLAAATASNAPTPDALNAALRDMTVLVSCWE